MKCFYSLYELKFKSLLGLSQSHTRSGALLNIDGGFADLHPWPELGDASLSEQLKSISQSVLTPLSARSLKIAKIDAEARRTGRSLFTDLEIPPSHLLIDSTLNFEKSLNDARAQGFERVKIKSDADYLALMQRLLVANEVLNGTSVKIRLDFNEQLTPNLFAQFLGEIPTEIMDRIDFFEDPFLYDPIQWQEISEKFNCRLALDRKNEVEKVLGFDISVVKPAIHEPMPFLEAAAKQMKRIVITSYLDHPLGQMAAAYEAGLALRAHPYLLEPCALISHLNYEPNSFSECISNIGPYLIAPSGAGLGFDDLLNALDWKAL